MGAGNDNGKPGLSEGTPHYVWNGSEYVTSTKERKASCHSGYDCITHGGVAKNILSVGSIHKASYNSNRESYQLSYFSSRGPTDDGRIKPDVVAAGSHIISTDNGGYYTAISGTSMAAPHVTGGVALIQEASKKHLNKKLQASTVKALIVNTANDAGNIGPDYHFGWGVMDTYKAIKTIENNKKGYRIKEHTLKNTKAKFYKLTASGDSPLKATIAWTDVPGSVNNNPVLNDRTPKLVNDLDIRIYDTNQNTYLPWKLDVENPSNLATKDDNTLDNVEQIVIDNPDPNASYTLEVTHKGELINSKQTFSLVISGLKAKKETDYSIHSLYRKMDEESIETAGLHVVLESEVKESLVDGIRLKYTVKSGDNTIVFKKSKTISYDFSEDGTSYFINFEDDGFLPLEKLKYTVDVEVTHDDDSDNRNNMQSISYYNFIAKIVTKDDIYYQNFYNYDTALARLGFRGSDDPFNFGWDSNTSPMTNYRTRNKGVSLNMVLPESKVRTNPFYLIKNQNYKMAFWAKNIDRDQNNEENEEFLVKVKDLFSGEIIQEFHVDLKQNANTSGENGFYLYRGTFRLEENRYVQFQIENSEGKPSVLDDFVVAFAKSDAVIVDYTFGPLLNYSGFSRAYKIGWNEFYPLLYNQDYILKEDGEENYTYSWEVKGEHVFEKRTNSNSKNPKIRLVGEGRELVKVSLNVNDHYSSFDDNPVEIFKSFLFYYYGVGSDYGLSFEGNSEFTPEGYNISGFRNSKMFFTLGIIRSRPSQINDHKKPFYTVSFLFDNPEDIEILKENRKEKVFRAKNPASFQLQMNAKDKDKKGTYFNQTLPLLKYTIFDQFQPIHSLSLEENNKNYKLKWKNPDTYHFDVMSFDETTADRIETVSYDGLEKLGWRVYSSSRPKLSINGIYSIVSESIDEDTFEHYDVDNWVFIKEAKRVSAKYFSFLASMAQDYNRERYEVYLLDASKVSNPSALSTDDFLEHGVLVKTEENTGKDIYLPNLINFTHLKIVNLRDFKELKNKDVYIAFRHTTRATDRGSFLSIDLLKFHNVLDKTVHLNHSQNKLFNTSGLSDKGWYSLNHHVYPVKGYEIAAIHNNGEREIIEFVENERISNYKIKKDQYDFSEVSELGVTLIYNMEHKTDDPEEQALDIPEHVELRAPVSNASEAMGLSLGNGIYAYPVPVTSDKILNLNITNEYIGELNVKVHDIMGREVFNTTLIKDSIEELKNELHLKDIKRSGVYYITVNVENKSYKKGILVNAK